MNTPAPSPDAVETLRAEENARVHALAAQCRSIANRFRPGFKLSPFLRDVADELERLFEEREALSAAPPTAVVEEGHLPGCELADIPVELASCPCGLGDDNLIATMLANISAEGGMLKVNVSAVRAALSASRARIEAEVIERCAKVAESYVIDGFATRSFWNAWRKARSELAAAIRALPITKAEERDNG